MQYIDVKGYYPRYKEEFDQALQEVITSGAYIMGPKVAELEGVLAKYVGVKHCISVASGTDALQIALMALGVGHGDEVITVPFTWISSAEAISLVGATPVFVDIEEKGYNFDPAKWEKAITPKTKAIMPVSLFGQMPDYEAINAIAAKHNLPVIEDGAQSFGATQNGKPSCGVTLIGCTSFYPTKPLGCWGEGGAIFSNDDALSLKMRAIRTHGGVQRHEHKYIGMNGRLDTIQAAVLLVKMRHFQSEVDARIKIGAKMTERLSKIPGVVTPYIQPGNTHVYAQFTIRVPGSNRDKVRSWAQEKHGIPILVFYPKCLHHEDVYLSLGYKKGDLPVAEKAADEVMSLPFHPWITDEEIEKIAVALEDALKNQ